MDRALGQIVDDTAVAQDDVGCRVIIRQHRDHRVTAAWSGKIGCRRYRATRGSCPVSGYRGVDRLLECETVCDHAEEKCRDQDRCGECKHSDGIHGVFPRPRTSLPRRTDDARPGPATSPSLLRFASKSPLFQMKD
jgi:hypothetical protein